MGSLFFGVMFIIAALSIWKFVPNSTSEKITSVKRIAITTMSVIGAFIMLTGAAFIASADKIYVIQYPWGGLKAVTTNGIAFSGYGKVTEYDKVISVKTISYREEDTADVVQSLFADNDDDNDASASGLLAPINIRFTDAAQANLYFLSRYRLPLDEQSILKFHKDFGSESALINNSFKPNAKAVAINNARLMSIQDYIGKKGAQFDAAFSDQLENGLYQTRVKQIKSASIGSSTTGVKVKGNTIEYGTGQTGKSDQIVEVVEILYDQTGQPLRQGSNAMQEYGIDVVEAKVTFVDPETEVKTLIKKQRDAEAKGALAENDIRRLKLEAQKERVEGEKRVEKEKAEFLADQTKRTIIAETIKQEALISAQKDLESMRLQEQTAAVNLKRAELEAQAITVMADAEAHKKKVILEADNALKEKLATFEAINETWANAYAKRNVPKFMLGGGGAEGEYGNTDASTFMSILTTKALQDIDLNLNVKK